MIKVFSTIFFLILSFVSWSYDPNDIVSISETFSSELIENLCRASFDFSEENQRLFWENLDHLSLDTEENHRKVGFVGFYAQQFAISKKSTNEQYIKT